MRIGVLQYAPEFGRIDYNIERVSRMLEPVEADLFVLPELFATGYIFEDATELRALAEPFPGGRTHLALDGLAAGLDAGIIGGFPELDGEKVFNSALFVRPGEDTVIYRKLHLFNREKLLFTPGDTPLKVVEFRGARIGPMICFDWIFPETYRTLALMGADIICHISNLVLPYCQKASYAHAVSNRIFIALSNRTGRENRAGIDLNFTGGSIVYSPSGDVLGKLSANEESVLTVEVDPTGARNKFVTERNDVFADRRPRFYEII